MTSRSDLPRGLQDCMEMLESHGFEATATEMEEDFAGERRSVDAFYAERSSDDAYVGCKMSTGCWIVMMYGDGKREVYETWAYPRRVHEEVRMWLDDSGAD